MLLNPNHKEKTMRLLLIVCVVSLTYSQDCTADDGTDGVTLWGVCYSIANTTILDLSNTGLTGEIPMEIGNLVNLTQLKLPLNDLTGAIPESIGDLTQLTRLLLYNNQLTDALPDVFSSLTSLYQIELSSNQLSGEIPGSIWSLTSLSTLNLSDNQFSGEIPTEIGTLSNLDYLKLSTNNLSGIIPESICDLSLDFVSSQKFSVYENEFCPPYPSCIEDYVGEQDTSECEGTYGCTDPDACNYDPEATVDDGSCLENDCAGVCDGTAEEDECGVCGGDGTSCEGCTDPDACNTLEGCNDDASSGEIGFCVNFPDQCQYIADGECDCTGNILDECGVCGGDGIADGDCDCDGNQAIYCEDCDGNCLDTEDCAVDQCGECGGMNNTLDYCGICDGDGTSCEGCTDPDACNTLEGCNDDASSGEIGFCVNFPDQCQYIADGECDCTGNILDECGVCGGDGPADGFDCFGDPLSLFNGLIPEDFGIHSIYPNPFNPVTNITYGLPEHVDVQIIVYNLSGKQVETLINEFQTPGYHSVNWNADNLPSGVYFVKMVAGEFVNTQKLVLVK
jgi:hypothetical protein